MERWLTYDQISLIPTQVSTIEHRAGVDTSVQFGPAELQAPIIAAPMPDVSNGRMARMLGCLGLLGFIHRFQPLEQRLDEYKNWNFKAYKNNLYDHEVGVAIPVNTTTIGSFYDAGARIFCIDTANGANKMVEKAVKTLKDKYPDIFIVTGNIASSENFQKLQEWGVDAIRVGIAGGSVCETRTETGVYSPMVSVIKDIMKDFTIPRGQKGRALLIADGGIKTPADMCKALALGADMVMMGGALAGTKESPGDIIKLDGKLYKKLRGAASFGVQKETNGKDPSYVEGTETLVPYTGSVEGVINRFAAGLRSSMSYMNARTLEEYRRNVKIIEV